MAAKGEDDVFFCHFRSKDDVLWKTGTIRKVEADNMVLQDLASGATFLFKFDFVISRDSQGRMILEFPNGFLIRLTEIPVWIDLYLVKSGASKSIVSLLSKAESLDALDVKSEILNERARLRFSSKKVLGITDTLSSVVSSTMSAFKSMVSPSKEEPCIRKHLDFLLWLNTIGSYPSQESLRGATETETLDSTKVAEKKLWKDSSVDVKADGAADKKKISVSKLRQSKGTRSKPASVQKLPSPAGGLEPLPPSGPSILRTRSMDADLITPQFVPSAAPPQSPSLYASYSSYSKIAADQSEQAQGNAFIKESEEAEDSDKLYEPDLVKPEKFDLADVRVSSLIPQTSESPAHSFLYSDYSGIGSEIEPPNQHLYEYLCEDDRIRPEHDPAVSQPRDSVRFSAFSAPQVLQNQEFEVNIWSYTVFQYEDVIRTESDKSHMEKGSSDDVIVLERGTQFSVTLEPKHDAFKILSESTKHHEWSGQSICSVFRIRSADELGEFDFIARIKIHGVIVAHVDFSLTTVSNLPSSSERQTLQTKTNVISSLFAFAVPEDQLEFLRWKLLILICTPKVRIHSTFDQKSKSDIPDWNRYDSIVIFWSNSAVTNERFSVTCMAVASSSCNLVVLLISNSTSDSGSTLPDKLSAAAVSKDVLYRKFNLPSSASSLLDAPVTDSKGIDSQAIVLRDKIGEGCFGQVFAAQMKDLSVVVKKLHLDFERMSLATASDILYETCVLEYVSSQLRNNQYVVNFLGALVLPQELWLVSEFIAGGDLKSFLYNCEVSFTTKLKIMLDAAKGVDALHKLKIVHRDIAARNFLVSSDGVKISDFGMSKFLKSTETSEFIATEKAPVRWMSPESLLWSKFSCKTDIWSLGMVFWEILTGENPLPMLSNPEIIELYTKLPEQIYEYVKPPAGLDPNVCDVLNACWRLPHSKRAAASEIVKKLELLV